VPWCIKPREWCVKKPGYWAQPYSNCRYIQRTQASVSPEDGFVLRAVEDIVPDAFHRGAHQLGLGAKIVVDAAHRHTAGRSHGADVDCSPSILLDEGTTGF